MRNEEEVLSQLLDYAKLDARVKVVLLNGSRVNPNVRKDDLRDYDVIFGVTETSSFVQNQDGFQVSASLSSCSRTTSRRMPRSGQSS